MIESASPKASPFAGSWDSNLARIQIGCEGVLICAYDWGTWAPTSNNEEDIEHAGIDEWDAEGVVDKHPGFLYIYTPSFGSG